MGQPRRFNWLKIQLFFDEGHSITECRQAFGFSYASWRKALRRGDIVVPEGGAWANRRTCYDWAAIQRYYDEGHSYRECRTRFGFAAQSWHKAVCRKAIRTRPLKRPIETVLREAKSRTNLKKRLLEAGLLENRCGICRLSEWQGKPLSIQIDHINGIRNDNRLENLRMLCPNCHSQTETFASRNWKNIQRSGFS